MNFKQIQQLIKFVSKTDVNEVTIENKDFKINIKGKSFNDDKPAKVAPESLIPRQAHQTIYENNNYLKFERMKPFQNSKNQTIF